MGTELGAEGLSPVLPCTGDVGLAAWHRGGGGSTVQGTAPCPGQGQPHGWHIATPQLYRECQPQPHGTAGPTSRTQPHIPCRATATPRDRTLSLAWQCHPRSPQGSASPRAPCGRAHLAWRWHRPLLRGARRGWRQGAQRGVAPGQGWARSGLGEIERNKQIRGQILRGGLGGSKGLLLGWEAALGPWETHPAPCAPSGAQGVRVLCSAPCASICKCLLWVSNGGKHQ